MYHPFSIVPFIFVVSTFGAFRFVAFYLRAVSMQSSPAYVLAAFPTSVGGYIFIAVERVMNIDSESTTVSYRGFDL
jgi:hypothetical protein